MNVTNADQALTFCQWNLIGIRRHELIRGLIAAAAAAAAILIILAIRWAATQVNQISEWGSAPVGSFNHAKG